MTNAKDIFDNASFEEGTVEVEAWGGEIKIRELNARQAGKVVTMSETDGLRSNALAVAYAVIDDNGKRVFTDAQVEKILDKLRVQDIAEVAMAVMKLSNPEGVEEK